MTTPHELRHTATSLLVGSGAGPKSIQAQLGHSTIVRTFDVYGHLFEGHLDDVMDRLDASWRAARAAPVRRKRGPEAPGDVLELPER